VASWSARRDLPEPSAATEGLWLLGTAGPAISVTRAGPGNLLRYGGTTALIDCGYGVLRRLAELGIGAGDVTHVLLTHLHADHVADLGALIMSPWVQRERPDGPPVVVGPAGTFEFVDRLLLAYDCDIRARIPHGYDPDELAVPVVEADDGTLLDAGPWIASAFLVDHWPVEPALGYRIESAMGVAVVSGDTRPCPAVPRWASCADVLVHEVLYPGFGIPSYHTAATDVGEIAVEAEVKRLVLTHLIPADLPEARWLAAVGDIGREVTVGTDLLRLQAPPSEVGSDRQRLERT
jgi:ribonuclease Z